MSILVNMRNALSYGFKMPFGLSGLEGWPPYLYNLSVEENEWDEGLQVSAGELRKEEDHLYLEALGPSAEYSYVRTVKIDFTNIEALHIDWENIGDTSGQNSSSLCVGDNAEDTRDTYIKRLHLTEDFIRRQDNLDVSDLSGEYLVRVHVTGGDSFSEIPGKLKVFKIWVVTS